MPESVDTAVIFVPVKTDFDFAVMRDCRGTVHWRHDSLPDAKLIARHAVGIAVPVV